MIDELFQLLRIASGKALGWSDEASSKMIRTTYQPNSAPFPKDNKTDAVYIYLDIAGDPISQQRDVSEGTVLGSEVSLITEYLLVVQARWVVYGPHAADNVFALRDGIFRQDIYDYCIENNLFLVTDPTMPRRFPEHYNANWWERWDLSAKFNRKITLERNWPWLLPGPIIIKEG